MITSEMFRISFSSTTAAFLSGVCGWLLLFGSELPECFYSLARSLVGESKRGEDYMTSSDVVYIVS